ncbi:ALF repeat-containing protein [Amycolatopsis nivea]
MRNATIVAFLFCVLAGLLTAPASAAPATADDGDPTPVLTDRNKVVDAWRNGGPGVREAAEAALTGTDAAVRQFLDQGFADYRVQDDRVQVAQLLATAGPAVKTAAQAALSGPPEKLREFLSTGV